MAKSNVLKTAMRNLLYRETAYTPPTAWYLAFYSANPGDDLASVPPLLPTRFEVTSWNNDGSFAATNASAVVINNSTGATITINYFSVHDAETAGRALHIGTMNPGFVLPNGTTFTIDPGRIKIEF